ncbi:class I SAM-dependent methyltransferase [Mycobacterium sp. smrl_JER01]|uniref:class I SAM-dependent methyltransferase n=1 Tax=Mycobacterium sp. smrl_JER01 TaxID=3402633 RepID=UPI003AC3BDF1
MSSHAARKRARERNLPVEFILGDAQSFASPPHTFDVQVSRFGVMFFDDPTTAFANLHRAIRPGGRLTFVCWRDPKENPFMSTAEQAAARLLTDLTPGTVGSPGPFAFADARRTKSVLCAGGCWMVTARS